MGKNNETGKIVSDIARSTLFGAKRVPILAISNVAQWVTDKIKKKSTPYVGWTSGASDPLYYKRHNKNTGRCLHPSDEPCHLDSPRWRGYRGKGLKGIKGFSGAVKRRGTMTNKRRRRDCSRCLGASGTLDGTVRAPWTGRPCPTEYKQPSHSVLMAQGRLPSSSRQDMIRLTAYKSRRSRRHELY